LVVLAASAADAQPRSSSAPRQAPALPQSGHQTEAIDLNEGKTPAQMFSSDCAVCHQNANGLAKGRNTGQLAGFLRQHYTTGTQQAGMLAAFLTSGGLDRGGPAPAVARDAPIDRPGARERGPIERPPAAIGARRPPTDPNADDPAHDGLPSEGRRKPSATEASQPPERDNNPGRKPGRGEARKPPAERQPAGSARAPKPAAPEVKQSEAPTAAAPAPETPAAASAPAASPAEEKPAAPPPPPAPEIRI
jgi:hypothetical protein